MPQTASASHRGRNPHPILKRDSSPLQSPALPFSRSRGGPLFSPHVHFPPTPGMSSTYPAHSPTTYDRKPIAVSPNVVQLPRRGERRLQTPPANVDPERRGRGRSRSRGRGRFGNLDDAPVKGSYFHPRAFEACMPEPANVPAPPLDFSVPALIQDLSPSDESDEAVLTPPGVDLPGLAAGAGAMPLHLPESPKARRSSFTESSASASPPQASLPVPPRRASHHGKDHQTASAHSERRQRRKPAFSPELDEGCLGGF